MYIRYLKADSLMCLLLPKHEIQLPWRGQPNVLFGFSFSEWQRFISDRRDGIIRRYREVRELPEEEQKMYFYADACLSQLNELLFSGADATNVLATEKPMNEADIVSEAGKYLAKGVGSFFTDLSRFLPKTSRFGLENSVSCLCLLYCYHKSREGDYNVWIRK